MDGDYTQAEHTYIVATLENIREPIINERYNLPESVRAELLATPTPFKSAYSECVYLRTYSRQKPDGSKEKWAETVIRVIEGTVEAYLTHYRRNGLSVDRDWLDQFAAGMARSFFHREWSPPGRGLYAMGTDHTRRNGNAALNNCYACETKNLVLAAAWAMDQLMCGGGVGFDCSWDGEIRAPDKTKSFTFVIPDTRQGWVAALELLLRSYLPIDGKITNDFPIFDFSKIRPYGQPIRGFGGLSSGPEPLKILLTRVEIFLDTYLAYQTATTVDQKKEVFRQLLNRLHQNGCYPTVDIEVDRADLEKSLNYPQKTYDRTRLVVDIFNSIGACVVAGNVRRCLPYYALVHTRRGLIPIRDVQVGDEVVTYRGYCSVTEVIHQGYQPLIKIVTTQREFKCTANHRMAVVTGRYQYDWKMAGQLTSNDCLVALSQQTKDSIISQPEKVVAVVSAEVDDTYDLSVAGRHEFFCQHLLTHNSAEIGISHSGDQTFLDLKNDLINPERRPIRWMSNNSVRFERDEDFEKYIPPIAERVRDNGEPGFFNLKNTRKFGRITDTSYGEDPGNLLNPCVTADTLVMTDNGMIPVSRLVGRPFNAVVDGRAYPSSREGFWQTGEKECFLLTLENGMKVEATANHQFLMKDFMNGGIFRWIQVKDLEQGNVIALNNNFGYAWQGGKGTWREGYLKGLEGATEINELNLSYDFTCGFLCGFFEARGVIERQDSHKDSNLSVSENLEILEIIQRLLSSVGIYSRIFDRRLSVTSSCLFFFEKIIGFEDPIKRNQLRSCQYDPTLICWESAIESIVSTGVKPVYDCRVDEIHAFSANGILAHNCGEIILQSFEPCTLATICPYNCRDNTGRISMDRVIQASHYATFYATTVTTVKHHWGVTNAVVAHNRRIGISLTGISNIYERFGFTYLTTICRRLYREIRGYNQQLAAQAGIPRSIRVTTVKPEGTLSILLEVNAGVHFPICRYAKRRIAIAKNSDLLPSLVEAGYPIEESIYDSSMVYVIFPIEFGECRPSREVSIYEQFSIVAALQRCYADNSVSFTGHFSQEREGADVERVMAIFAPQIKACSLLPYSDNLDLKGKYTHLPFEEISQVEYKELVASVQPVKWNFKGEDVSQPRGCNNDTCSL